MTSNTIALPKSGSVATLMTDLVGVMIRKEIAAVDGKPLAFENNTLVAVFQTDNEQIGALALFEFSLSCYLGAALALMPPGRAEDNIMNGEISEAICENIYEIANIMASLFNHQSSSHFKLVHLGPISSDLPGGVLELMESASIRGDYIITVPTYGSGSLVILGA